MLLLLLRQLPRRLVLHAVEEHRAVVLLVEAAALRSRTLRRQPRRPPCLRRRYPLRRLRPCPNRQPLSTQRPPLLPRSLLLLLLLLLHLPPRSL